MQTAPAQLTHHATTESQREIWTACQLGADASLAYNESVTLVLQGAIDVDAMCRALVDLEKRHESLRLKIAADGLTYTVSHSSGRAVPISWLSKDPAALKKAKAGAVTIPFDLGSGSLFRAEIVVGSGEHYVLLTAHHMVCDGWSSAILMRDLGALYSAQCQGNTNFISLPVPPQFSGFSADCSAYQESLDEKSDSTYWRSVFAAGAPVMDLPSDKTRPKMRSFNADRIDQVLPIDIVKALKKAAAKERASFFMALLSSYHILLWKILGSDSVVTAVPAAAQAADGLFDLVGHCVNTLPIMGSPAEDATFAEYLRTIRALVMDAYDHQKTSFGRILQLTSVERDPSRLPLAPVIFNVDKKFENSDLAFAGMTATYQANPRAYEAFEIFINVAESNGQCVIECQFNTDLYTHDWIRSHLDSYEALLRSIVARPDAPIRAHNWAPLRQLEQQYFQWNQHEAKLGACSILQLIDATIARCGDKVAVISGEESLTYQQLGAASNQWARLLQSRGVGPDSFVGVMVVRSARMLPILLGIMKAGGCYVPLDPDYPKDRLSYMITQSGCTVIVADLAVSDSVPQSAAVSVIMTDAFDAEKGSGDPIDYMEYVTGDTLAYVIFTSGSTGLPKGVLVPHLGVVNLLQSIATTPGFDGADRLLAVTTLSFDVSVAELFMPVAVGGTLVIAQSHAVKDATILIELIASQKISCMPATPATWRMLLDTGWVGAPLKAISTGEPLPRELADQLLPKVASLWNFYGPTEVTVWATGEQVKKDEPILIGAPIAGISIYVVDRFGHPVPWYMPGELYLGGVGVTKGYVGRTDLTDERFVVLPGIPELTKVYRTGDLVRLRSDGRVDYIGRNDSQVKVRGYRIELGEIESVVASCVGVLRAIVLVREDRPGDKRIVAYVEAQESGVTEAYLSQCCRERLPAYMVPQHLVILSSLPLLSNGKVNRKGLLPPVADLSSMAEDDSLRGPFEERLAAIWGELLGLAQVPATKSFYNLGGHSLLAMRMLATAQREFEVAISLRTLLEHNSVRALAAIIAGPKAEKLSKLPQLSDGKKARLSIIQERVYYLDMLNPDDVTNLLPDGRIIRGPLDVALFQRVIRKIIDRHPLLRAIVVDDAAGPMMLVRDQIVLDLSPIDLSHLEYTDQQLQIAAVGREMTSQPMNVTAENLIRLKIFRLAPDVHVFATVFHHLIWDGWCFDIFWSEIHELYLSAAKGQMRELADPGCRYLDFAMWHRQQSVGTEHMSQLPFWQDYLKNMRCLELVTDWPRPARKAGRGERQQFYWDQRQTDLLQSLARSEQTTPFVVMLALYKYLLALYSGQRDIIVGTPVQGRGHPDFANVIGYFVNTLVLRTELAGLGNFREVIRAVKSSSERAFRHQDIAFEEIVKVMDLKPEPSRTTIYSVMFAYQDTSNRASDWLPLTLEQINLPQNAVGTDLVLWVRKHGGGLTGGFDYRTDLFSEQRIATMISHLTLLLERLAADPDQAVMTNLILMPPAMVAAVQPGLTGQGAKIGSDLLSLIRDSAEAHGNEPFLTMGTNAYTGNRFVAEWGHDASTCVPGDSLVLSRQSWSQAEVAGVIRAVVPVATGATATVVDGKIAFDSHQAASAVRALKHELGGAKVVYVPDQIAGIDDLRWLLFALGCGGSVVTQAIERDNPYEFARFIRRSPHLTFRISSAELANFRSLDIDLPRSSHLVISGPPPGLALSKYLAEFCNARVVLGLPNYGMWSGCGVVGVGPDGQVRTTWQSLAGELIITPRGVRVTSESQASGLFMAGPLVVRAVEGGGGGALSCRDTGYSGFMAPEGLVILGQSNGTEEYRNYMTIRREEKERSLLNQSQILYVHIGDSNAQTTASLVVPSATSLDELAGISAAMRRLVPHYLMCDQVNLLEALPIAASGEVSGDHPLLKISSTDRSDGDEPVTVAEKAMAEIWCRVLATSRVCRHDNFFDLGGYSLLPLLVINEVEKRTGVRLNIAAFLTQNLQSIAAQSGFDRSNPAETVVQS